MRICPPSTDNDRFYVGVLILVDLQCSFHTVSAFCSCWFDGREQQLLLVLGQGGEGRHGCTRLGDTLDLLRAVLWWLAAVEGEVIGFGRLEDEYFKLGEGRRDGYIERGYGLARLPFGKAMAECCGYEVQKDSAYAGWKS